MGYNYFDTGVQVGKVSERMHELLTEYMTRKYPEVTDLYEIKKCYMPWARMFEIGLVVREK